MIRAAKLAVKDSRDLYLAARHVQSQEQVQTGRTRAVPHEDTQSASDPHG
jgi:hypothetical protein